jgi:hypothetical protein
MINQNILREKHLSNNHLDGLELLHPSIMIGTYADTTIRFIFRNFGF